MQTKKILKNLKTYSDHIESLSVFTPAAIFQRYPILLDYCNDCNIHGFLHTEYTLMPHEKQKTHLLQASQIFKKAGVKKFGFRAPYLRTNHDLLQLVKESGYLYDSSCSIHWDIIPQIKVNRYYRQILAYYQPLCSQTTKSLPFFENGLLRIPVSLPDDEMLIDRLRIKDQDDLYHIWSSLLSKCRQKEELFVLQLHPERYHLANRALKKLIEKARHMNMWITSMKNLAVWWYTESRPKRWPEDKTGAFCITGDLDCLNLYDYLRR